jgi:anti-sigma factor RsiW
MNEHTLNRHCERGGDLLSFLYGETDERETRDFGQHLEKCEFCRSELSAFGQVRESISLWKHESLSPSLPPRVELVAQQKSAISAIRQFFDLSPLWLKGAVGFTVVVFCVMAVLAFASLQSKPVQSSTAKYSDEQLRQAVADALKERSMETVAATNQQDENQPKVRTDNESPRKITARHSSSSTRWTKTSKPLSRSERDQLATDLRLLTTKDDDGLNLLVDRINQEF